MKKDYFILVDQDSNPIGLVDGSYGGYYPIIVTHPTSIIYFKSISDAKNMLNRWPKFNNSSMEEIRKGITDIRVLRIVPIKLLIG